MRTTHELKIWPEYFEQVRNGRMKFQLRRNDRDYKVGDQLLLKEWVPGEDVYTRREVIVRVDYIMDDAHRFGVNPDYVIMSVSLIP